MCVKGFFYDPIDKNLSKDDDCSTGNAGWWNSSEKIHTFTFAKIGNNLAPAHSCQYFAEISLKKEIDVYVSGSASGFLAKNYRFFAAG